MANAQINVKFITNRRGGRNLAFNGYIYRVNRRTDNKIFWRCTTSGCSASISTENDIPTGFGRQQHTHAADHTEVVAKQIMTAISRRCTDEVRPIPSIFSEELNKLRDNEWDDTSRELIERLLSTPPGHHSTEPAGNRHHHFQRLQQTSDWRGNGQRQRRDNHSFY